jgi:hypothetical protein
MSRRLLIGLAAFVVALTATVAAALGAQSTTSSSKPAPPSVSLAVCHPSDAVDQRYASFTGQMRALPGTKRMAMHFTLLERLSTNKAGFLPVSLQDLKPWRKSKRGARTFIYTQRVTALRDAGSYRMRVQFRWYGDHKTVLRTSTVRSRTCRQPAPRPNLTITSITSMPVPAMAGKRTYAITVANNGPGEATNVPVALKVDGVVVGSAKIDLLPAQESSLAQIVGPQCAFTVRAVADPDKQIRETDESDNAFTLPCAQVTS